MTDTSVWEPLPPGPRLNGRKILITGAALGMGRAIAQLFAREGAALALLDANGDGVAEVARELGAHGINTDVSIPEQVERSVAEANEVLRGIDGVVNAAGILRVAPFSETAPDLWRRVHDVNLFGPYLVCRAALPALQRSGKATIVNIASMGGIKIPPGMSAYGASKAGLIGLSKGLALELAPAIRVNAICPGIIKTAMTDALWAGDPTGGAESVRRAVGLQRKGTPMEIAYLTLFLTCDESSFITGSVYTIDGGPVGTAS
jgi:NAD(P)-dependent dehydrogenase (short-subunit alcohol dehydrogenase family)